MPSKNELNQCKYPTIPEEDESVYEGSSDGLEAVEDEPAATAPKPMASLSAARADQKLVRGARITVMLVLLVSALTVATLAYVLLSRSEAKSFRDQFESSAKQVILMANRNAANVFVSFHTMAAIFPSHAQASSSSSNENTLPFVTIADFATLANGFRTVSKASYVSYSPLLRSEAELHRWNNYSVTHAASWIAEGRQGQDYTGRNVSDQFAPFVYAIIDAQNNIAPQSGNGPFVPTWMMSPVPANVGLINIDAWSYEFTRTSLMVGMETGRPSLSAPIPGVRTFHEFDVKGPLSFVYQPVFDKVMGAPNKTVVGFLTAALGWKFFLDNTLPAGQNNIVVVVQSCDMKSTFIVNGPEATFFADGDHHDPKFNDMLESASFVESDADDAASATLCRHTVHVYPTKEFENDYLTNTPMTYAIVTLAIFAFAAIVFLTYDYFVTSRQDRTEKSASKSNAIVQDLFPGDMAQRLFDSTGAIHTEGGTPSKTKNTFGKLDRDTIAELHPDATILFADISGFTAWSSIRDPHQVFKLLESVFQAFDAIAKTHRVFKVETVGDCYVAVCGVPKRNDLHAVVMCRFARSAMVKFRSVCRSLELLLGPDTGDLALRIGMHSGPVTGGVLRGDRARFQLFGDTVNTASRIESSGMRERVHVSEQTALQLIAHGKEDWIVKREDAVEAKGKGKLVTYWLKLSGHQRGPGSVSPSSVGDSDVDATVPHQHNTGSKVSVEMPAASKADDADQRNERLVQWNSEILLELLQRVVARRAASPSTSARLSSERLTAMARSIGKGSMVVEEVAEIIDMPDFVATNESDDVELSDVVVEQLRDFVAQIASMYNDNPFHNFEHASHVTMSINKLLCRIVAPSQMESSDVWSNDANRQAAVLHDHTCGITSDPLTQFAVVLSGLIHDLDHPGVSNGQLIKEDPMLASRYQEKSVAEQNSVDLAWTILVAPKYEQLRMAIFATETELVRFRSLLVNSIIATDIFDKDQSTLRKNRWNKAFFETTPEDSKQEVKSRKATIVIEHLIQASDVAHTMQHWHVYQKWNQRLFDEMMMAYRNGRSDKDPSEGWYGGELWFFDNYILPLTKKLKDCGVFGVSSDEYLNYAQHNRDEWQAKGKDVVHQYLDEFEAKFEACSDATSATTKVQRVTL